MATSSQAHQYSNAIPTRVVVPKRMIGSQTDQKERKRWCRCKRSACLKMYCECFSNGLMCETQECRCVSCYNNQESEAMRNEAMKQTLERNPAAFRTRTLLSGVELRITHHNKGCNCKRSNCLKKYCECFAAGLYCASRCHCSDCKNVEKMEAPDLAGEKGIQPEQKRAKLSGEVVKGQSDPVPKAANVAGKAQPKMAEGQQTPGDERPLEGAGGSVGHSTVSSLCSNLLQAALSEVKAGVADHQASQAAASTHASAQHASGSSQGSDLFCNEEGVDAQLQESGARMEGLSGDILMQQERAVLSQLSAALQSLARRQAWTKT
ncbi:unnamed protein product [Chrysoparadoxa australica]